MRTLNVPSNIIRSFALYSTKGLIDVAEAELKEIVSGAVVRERQDRFLVVALTADDAERVGTQARLLDDVRMVVAGPSPVRSEGDLLDLCSVAAAEVEEAVAGAAGSEPWSVTLSARNPPWRGKPRWDPGPVFARALHGADPNSTSRCPVDVRVQIDGEEGHISVNLWDQPVGKRLREIASSWPGALRPTVAAALVRLAMDLGGKDAAAIGFYDPFCGSGTIAGEAARRGLAVFASDRSEQAVELTRQRLAGMGLALDDLKWRVFTRDVRNGPDQRVTARLVAANLPWGKQVQVDGALALLDATALLTAYTLQSGGGAALLTTNEEQLMPRLRRHGLTVGFRRIGLLGQTPAIVTCSYKPS